MKTILFNIASIVFSLSLAYSDTLSHHKPELGIGFSDNANYSDTNPKHDNYFWVKSFSSWIKEPSPLELYLSYKDFVREKQNNVFLWNTKMTLPSPNLLKEEGYFIFGLGGQNYTSSNPETTDEGFDNIFIEGAILKSKSWGQSNNWNFEPGYLLKHFEDTHRRTDHQIYLNSSLDLELNVKNLFTPMAEMGFIFSSDSLYRKNYFELGLQWSFKMQQTWTLFLNVFNRSSWFPGRTLTSVRQIPSVKKNQKTSVLSQNEIEFQSLSQVELSLIKEFQKLTTKFTLIKTSQLTKSETENFNELRLQCSIGYSF